MPIPGVSLSSVKEMQFRTPSAFTPSAKEIRFAKRVLEAVEEGAREGKGAVTLDGSMIDKPMELRARTTLAQAKAAGIVF